MITQEQYELARELKKENQNIIDQYFKQKDDAFKEKMKRFDAGKVSLKDNDTCKVYPFSSYSIKSEDQIDPRCEKNEKGGNKTFQEMGVTSRGVFKPKVEKCS